MFDNITRFEVIDEKVGRIIARYNIKIKATLQDNGRTLKIFVSEREGSDLGEVEVNSQELGSFNSIASGAPNEIPHENTNCENCGSHEANYVVDPYDQDIHGVERWTCLCAVCEHEYAQAI